MPLVLDGNSSATVRCCGWRWKPEDWSVDSKTCLRRPSECGAFLRPRPRPASSPAVDAGRRCRRRTCVERWRPMPSTRAASPSTCWADSRCATGPCHRAAAPPSARSWWTRRLRRRAWGWSSRDVGDAAEVSAAAWGPSWSGRRHRRL